VETYDEFKLPQIVLDECKLLPEPKRHAFIREALKMDHQYHKGDKDRLEVSYLSSIEKEALLSDRKY
jgi:hypothetical protein